ncbi:MAG: TlpA family protein disulfide reductase [Pyrinomonadaceae bacterium]
MRKLQALLPLLAAAIIFAPFLSTRATAQQPRPQQRAEEEAPALIALKGVDGKTYDLAKMRGDVVLVSFGATWCQPCSEELRALEELKKEYKNQPVKFLWISIESPEEATDKDLRGFAKANKLTFPVLRDPTKFTYAQFSTRVRLPLVLLYDKNGTLTAKQFGMSASPEKYKTFLRARFDKLLAAETGVAKTGSVK